jgi:hypothetical protein
MTQTTASPATVPSTSPPAESNVLSCGLRILVRRPAPASVPSVSKRIAPTAAPARAARGVYGELVPPSSSSGARRDPSQAPSTIPATDRALATKPFFHPMKAVSATKPSAIRSTLVTA